MSVPFQSIESACLLLLSLLVFPVAHGDNSCRFVDFDEFGFRTQENQSSLLLHSLRVGSLSLRPAISPLGNLQPLITQSLLPGATKVYGQLLRRDFNPLDRSPVTAYGRYPFLYWVPLKMHFSTKVASAPCSKSIDQRNPSNGNAVVSFLWRMAKLVLTFLTTGTCISTSLKNFS